MVMYMCIICNPLVHLCKSIFFAVIKVREAFEYTAQSIPNLTNENQVQQCFAALKGSVSISSIVALVPKLTEDHISAAEASFAFWSITKSWVE